MSAVPENRFATKHNEGSCDLCTGWHDAEEAAFMNRRAAARPTPVEPEHEGGPLCIDCDKPFQHLPPVGSRSVAADGTPGNAAEGADRRRLAVEPDGLPLDVRLRALRRAVSDGTDPDTGDVWLHREDADGLRDLLWGAPSEDEQPR